MLYISLTSHPLTRFCTEREPSRLVSLKCLLKGALAFTFPSPLFKKKKKMLIITWFYMESRLSFDFDECSSCQTLHLTKSRTFCRGLSYVTKPLTGHHSDRRWHMKGIPPLGFPRTMEHTQMENAHLSSYLSSHFIYCMLASCPFFPLCFDLNLGPALCFLFFLSTLVSFNWSLV